MFGQVYKVQSDFYAVKCEDKLIDVRSRGNVKKQGEGIVVGDFVEIENGAIKRVENRKNRFIRPNVCNVDTVVLVISAKPKPDYFLVDKLLVNAIKENVEVVFVVNKTDLSDDVYLDVFKEYSSFGIKVFRVSANTNDGIKDLKEYLRGKFSVLAGQSAVGKTSIVNAMFGLSLKTGELSGIGRGRHTTTRSEIFEMDGVKIIDSPGFAVIDADVSAECLNEYYPEYCEVSNMCKFRGCKHVNEPDCMVKQLVCDGKLSKERYDRYVEIYNELDKRRKIYEKN